MDAVMVMNANPKLNLPLSRFGVTDSEFRALRLTILKHAAAAGVDFRIS